VLHPADETAEQGTYAVIDRCSARHHALSLRTEPPKPRHEPIGKKCFIASEGCTAAGDILFIGLRFSGRRKTGLLAVLDIIPSHNEAPFVGGGLLPLTTRG